MDPIYVEEAVTEALTSQQAMLDQLNTSLSVLTEAQRNAQAWLEQMTPALIIWLCLPLVLLVLLAIVLVQITRMRRRHRKVEKWLDQELRNVREKLDICERGQQSLLRAIQPMPPLSTPSPERQSPVFPPPRPARPTPTEPRPQALTPPATEEEVLASINQLLTGAQPFNLIEAVRALNPRLELQRMTPRGNPDVWSPEVILDHGGDGLFAHIDQGKAWLYPNYNRFSATLDPKPLFEGARHGARIHSVQKPALLVKQADGTWILQEKGAVQMR